MSYCSILLFNWIVYSKVVGIATLAVWGIFLFYDYFIRSTHTKESIFDNPNSKANSFDNRPQIHTNQVEFDSMIK